MQWWNWTFGVLGGKLGGGDAFGEPEVGPGAQPRKSRGCLLNLFLIHYFACHCLFSLVRAGVEDMGRKDESKIILLNMFGKTITVSARGRLWDSLKGKTIRYGGSKRVTCREGIAKLLWALEKDQSSSYLCTTHPHTLLHRRIWGRWGSSISQMAIVWTLMQRLV